MSDDWPMTPSISYICKGGRYVKYSGLSFLKGTIDGGSSR